MVAALFVIGILALIAYSTIHGPRFRVEVCMAYQGRSSCKLVAGKSEEAALRSAITGACADIVSGVTDTVNCEQSEPKSTRWIERPR